MKLKQRYEMQEEYFYNKIKKKPIEIRIYDDYSIYSGSKLYEIFD